MGIVVAGLFGQGRCLIICRFAFGFGWAYALLGLDGGWVALRVPVTGKFFFG